MKFVWKQTPNGKWFKNAKSLQAANVEDMSENPSYTREDIEKPNSFLCGVCSTAMHFQLHNKFDNSLRCSICDRICSYSTVQLMCDNCELYVCCKRIRDNGYDEQKWKLNSSCYNSYYHQDEAVREQVYIQQQRVTDFSIHDRLLWLQCMWQDIVQNMNRFRAELHHATQVKTIDDTNASLVVENLGMGMTKSLVRLFVILHSKFDTDIVEWFSSLIKHQRELFGSVALRTSVKLNGRLEQLKWLVQYLSLDVSNCDFSGAVWIAATMGKLNILEYLLEDVGADPSADDNVAIRKASGNGHLKIVERLLQDERVDPSAQDNDAIRVASSSGHLSVVERLLEDVRVDPSANGNYAIRMASWFGHLNVIERLLQDDRVDPSAGDIAAIQRASWFGHLNVVERLLQDDRVDPSANGNYAIRIGSGMGNLNVVERLLQDDRVDPSANGNHAIRFASENGHLHVVERLLQDDRVDPSAIDNEAIRFASADGHLNVVERLLQDDRVDPSADDNYAIRKASCNGHLNVVERLLQDGRVDPSADDNCAIRWASETFPGQTSNGKLNVVKRLLQDNRVNPAAQHCEAIRIAIDDKIIKCLYDRTRNITCFMIDDEDLMMKISPLHFESLVIGGLCLNQIITGCKSTTTLPQDVISLILSDWASLRLVAACDD